MPAATHPQRCRCGALQGQITLGEPKPRAFGLPAALLRILRIVAGSRLSGKYKDNLFFTAAGAPVAEPTVLAPDERARLDAVSPKG